MAGGGAAAPSVDAHGRGKRTDIEGLRAIAVGLVLLYHGQLAVASGGFIGVDVFFVISGFLITGSLVREAEAGRISLTAFYARRARRLLPAAAAVLLATAAAVRWLLPPTMWRDFGGDIAAAAAYVVNWRFAVRELDYLAEDVLQSPVQHFWSLAIEEQFYLVWPLLMLAGVAVARRRGLPLRRVLLVTLVVVVVLPSGVWSVLSTASQPARAFLDTGTRMWELAAGGVVALLPRPTAVPARVATALKASSLVVLLAAAVLLDGSVPWPGAWAAVAVVPTCVLIALGGRDRDVVERALSVAPMQRVGAWSYSLYLWHWPPLAVLAARWDGLTVTEAMLVVAASFVPAVASHVLVENPVRFSSGLSRSPGFALSVGANLTLVGVLVGLVVGRVPASLQGPLELGLPDQPPTTADESVGDDAPDEPSADGDVVAPPPPPVAVQGPVGAAVLDPRWTETDVLRMLELTTSITPGPVVAVEDLPRVYDDRCHVPVTVVDVRVCAYGDPDGDVHVALVGDSKAGQWGDALETIGTSLGWRLSYLLKSGCELTAAVPDLGANEPNDSCRAWNDEALAMLLADPPDVVLVSQVSSTAVADDGEDRTEVAVEGMLAAYDRLEDAGVEVVVLLDNHSPSLRVYECVAENPTALAACAFERVERSGGRRAQLAVVERGDHRAIDMSDLVCPTATCVPVVGNVLVYRQGSHLTKSYIDTLIPALADRLRPVVDAVVAAGDGSPAAQGAVAPPPEA